MLLAVGRMKGDEFQHIALGKSSQRGGLALSLQRDQEPEAGALPSSWEEGPHPTPNYQDPISTFSMTRFPPKRVTNSAGEATVKSLCRSSFFSSRPLFTRWSPDMLGLKRKEDRPDEPGSLGHSGRESEA